jgi:hypothetical protein
MHIDIYIYICILVFKLLPIRTHSQFNRLEVHIYTLCLIISTTYINTFPLLHYYIMIKTCLASEAQDICPKTKSVNVFKKLDANQFLYGWNSNIIYFYEKTTSFRLAFPTVPWIRWSTDYAYHLSSEQTKLSTKFTNYHYCRSLLPKESLPVEN